MAYIMPGTEVYLCENNEADPSYQNTMYFSGSVMQQAHIAACAHYHFSNFTYQRVNRNTIRVGITADDLYAAGINYMAFQNASYGSKWFYAFVTNIEYVNNECSNLTFSIDILQTWLIGTDTELLPCMIDRMTVLDDTLGRHIEPENIATGEYVFNDYHRLEQQLDSYYVAVQVADSDWYDQIPGQHMIDGMYTGLTTLMFRMKTDEDAIKLLLDQFRKTPDNIVGMYAVPQANAIWEDMPGDYTYFRYAEHGAAYEYQLQSLTAGVDSIDGYVPKNNKLYTYPYNFLQVNNGSPETLTLRYEFFDSAQMGTGSITPWIYTISNVTPPVEVVLYPARYKGVPILNTESLTLTDFPLLSWNVDTYKVYQANQQTIGSYEFIQLGGNMLADTSKSVLGNAIGEAVLNPIDAAGDLVSAGVDMGQQAFNYAMGKKIEDYNASVTADQAKGNTAAGAVKCSNAMQNFFYGRMSVTAEYARVIDDFFSRYGYHLGTVEEPIITGRPHWNYVKTIGCLAKGKMPMDDRLKLQAILDGGVTFWQNVSSWGDYSLDNSI